MAATPTFHTVNADTFCTRLAQLAAQHPHGDTIWPRQPDQLEGATLFMSDTGLTLGAVTAQHELISTISLEHHGADMVAAQMAAEAYWAVTNMDNPRMTQLMRDAQWRLRYQIPEPVGEQPWRGADNHFPLLLWAADGDEYTITNDLVEAKQALAGEAAHWIANRG